MKRLVLVVITLAAVIPSRPTIGADTDSARWLLMGNLFASESEKVWKWEPQNVYVNAQDCKEGIEQYQSEVATGAVFNIPQVCLSAHDPRWGSQKPRWILGSRNPYGWSSFKALFVDKDHCELSRSSDRYKGEDIDCISLDDPQFEPTKKITWFLLVPPEFGAGSRAPLNDWDVHETYDDKQTCETALAADARLKKFGAVCKIHVERTVH
jgi:hypothetical protein